MSLMTSPMAPAEELAPFKRILVALDASEHADRGLTEAARLAAWAGGTVSGIHAYAAKMHDRRFRQMESGLPEEYREEEELGRQREVHDTLITRGLNVISDSYHENAEPVCAAAGVPYRAFSPEGKNYRRVVEAAASGDFDLLVLGAIGLGKVDGEVVGTVCERTVRRSAIDTLVIRDAARALGDGPIVVALDGSPLSFGSFKLALDLGRRLGVPVHAVAAYDPYFHYVAFHKIADVLSDEAAQVFKFKEQEKLHEDIIDAGLAKIYQSHLDVAKHVAEDEGVEITCQLLEGKPWQAIARYLGEVGASLVMLGKTGIHADPDLDIGGNAENLLRQASCHLWFGQTAYTPPLEAVAAETIAWSVEAEASLTKVPEAAQAMVRIAILRYAQERGHTVVTSDIMEEVTARFCPAAGGTSEPDDAPEWTAEATALIERVGDPSSSATIRLRAEKQARRDGAAEVSADHVRPFLATDAAPAPLWNAAALARLARVPAMVRPAVRARIEVEATEAGASEVITDMVEAGIATSRGVMTQTMQAGGHKTSDG